jgi:periplasmic protein TonB
MHATPSIPNGFEPYPDHRRTTRTGAIVAAVALAHVALLAIVFLARNERPPIAPVSRTITAELLSPAPVAAPVAVQSTPTPPAPTPPQQHAKPKPRPTPKPVVHELPPAAKPAPTAITTPEPPPPAPAAAAPSAPAPVAAAPAPGKPTVAISAPKNVSHLDCDITRTDYPLLSRRRGETGTAIVQFVVDVTGRIGNITLKKSSGFDRLDDAALAAVRSSSCHPYMENGEAIRATTSVPYVFNLSD